MAGLLVSVQLLGQCEAVERCQRRQRRKGLAALLQLVHVLQQEAVGRVVALSREVMVPGLGVIALGRDK